MRFVPRNYDLFDNMFDSFLPSVNSNNMMKTDIHELNGYYDMDIELPGYKKEDIEMEISDGYLNIKASRSNSEEEKDSKGNLIRQERFYGSISRSFYVGDNIKAEDIKASYENGILNINLPSREQKRIETSQKVELL